MSATVLRLDPLQVFLRLHRERHVCFLAGTGPERWETVLAFDPAEVFTADADDVEGFTAFVERSGRAGRKVIGCLAYEVGCRLHRIPLRARGDTGVPAIFFCAFDNYISFHGKQAVLRHADTDFPAKVAAIAARQLLLPAAYPPCRFIPETCRRWYRTAFRKIKRSIYDGEIYQVNLAHRLTCCSDAPARELFVSLMRKNPVGFLGFLDGGHFQILSASPERFVKTDGDRIATFPIKGTRPHGGTGAARRRAELVGSAKEQAELNMITDLLRNDLGKVCRVGSVCVERPRVVRRCAAVWHAFSEVAGTLAPDITPVQALLSMLPGGSISGCPKKRALEIIDELEPAARSVYTGVIGTIEPDQGLDFNIAIRTIVKRGTRLWLHVGGGIVHESDEEQEYRETLAKARSLQNLC